MVPGPSAKSRRFRRRLVRHHGVLAAVSVGLVVLAHRVFKTDGSTHLRAPIDLWSLATAYVALALLGATLLIGPVSVLCGRRNPVSSDWRRDVGIWAGLVSLAHVGVGLLVHSSTVLGNFFCESAEASCLATPLAVVRGGLWGFGNWVGLAAASIVVLLMALSNDLALRRLGARRWKRLQRWNYGLFALVMIHAAAFQILEDRAVPYPWVLGIAGAAVTSGQAIAAWRHRRTGGRR